MKMISNQKGLRKKRYEDIQEAIESKMGEYDRMCNILEAAKKQVMEEYPEQFEQIAPNMEYNEAVDADQGREISDEFCLFLPHNKHQEQYDIGLEFNAKVQDSEIEIRVRSLPDAQFYAGVQTLNEQQHEFFIHVLRSTRDHACPYAVFISGGAGVGKSHVVNMLYQALDRELSRHPGDNPEDTRILLCAPTGKAAFNIHGYTIHSAFQIKHNQALSLDNQRLGDSQLNTLRSKF